MDPKFPGKDAASQVHTRVFGVGVTEPLHFHRFRAEVWIILKGEALIFSEGLEFQAEAGQSVTIPRFSRHGLVNKGDTPCEVLEVWIYPQAASDELKEDYILCEE